MIAPLFAVWLFWQAPAKKPAAATPRLSIQPERALQIQQGLIRAGYLDSASGVWDAASIAAMRRYQTDHHWQTQFVPDSRALIALGLGGGSS